MKTSLPYYAVQTEHNREVVARAAIQAIGFTVFLPQTERQVTHARKTISVLRPLFPGYLFVRFDVEHWSWRKIATEQGVRRVMRMGDQGDPVSIPEPVIADIRSQLNYGKGVIRETQLSDEYTEGQRLMVVDGPFTSFPALYQRKEEDRLVALIEIFGRSHEVRFEPKQVVAA